jgi:hypothetical protein
LGHLEISEFLEKKICQKTEKNKKLYFKNLENLEIRFLPEARELKELDHKQYELERFDHYINNA